MVADAGGRFNPTQGGCDRYRCHSCDTRVSGCLAQRAFPFAVSHLGSKAARSSPREDKKISLESPESGPALRGTARVTAGIALLFWPGVWRVYHSRDTKRSDLRQR